MLKFFEYPFPYKETKRRIHLWLPESYEESEETYPIFYFYDGHNLFRDEYATYGTSWSLEEFMEEWKQEMIIVGVECSHEGDQRLEEYCPYPLKKAFGGRSLPGYGDQFMKWMVEDLKPFIDENYKTKPEREFTGIGGSSMGGLMAFYSIFAHNDIFSKSASLSPSLYICMEELKRDFKKTRIDPNTRVYFSYGEKEVTDHPQSLQNINYFHKALKCRGAKSMLHIEKKGLHDEATWAKQNKRYFNFLWK